MNNQVNPGKGYRLLTIGERVEEGDEFRTESGDWKPRELSVGKFVSVHFYPTRRKLPPVPGPNYRALHPGEIIQAGDEYFYGGFWTRARGLIGGQVLANDFSWRRPTDHCFVGGGNFAFAEQPCECNPITPDQERIEMLVNLLELAVNSMDNYDGGFSYRLFRQKWATYRGSLNRCREIAKLVRKSREPEIPMPPTPELKNF